VAQTTVADSLETEVRWYSRQIRDRLPTLESRYARALKKAGYSKQPSMALQRVSLFAAVRIILKRRSLARHWQEVRIAGRELAKLNIKPTEVSAALVIADELAAGSAEPPECSRVRQQLRFATILVLNEAYYSVREEESQAFQRLLEIETSASNTDVLLRGMLEAVVESSGADAGHAFLLTGEADLWEVRASTSDAPTPQTAALVSVPGSVRRALGIARQVTNPSHILDPGWRDRFPTIWSIPLRDTGVLQFGFKTERELLPRDVEMLSSAGERCYAATRKTRMLEEITEREERLSKLAIRMLMVEENERRRISRELHDDAGQSLVVIRLQMELIEQLLPPGSEERERLAEARDITEKTILDIRRLISDLSPAVLEQLGLGAALRQLLNRFRIRYDGQTNLDVGQLPTLDSNFQLVVYRLAQECLNNISEHSKATTVNISVSADDKVLRLHVEDNGTGFDVEQTLERKDAFGLIGIRERVAVLGGTVDIISTRKEGQTTARRKKTGTVVRIQLPIR
jgi:signal transduction histidine kinase